VHLPLGLSDRIVSNSDVSEVIFVESKSSKIFSSRVRVMTWSSRELSSNFESLICKLESTSSHTKSHVISTFFCYKMAPDKFFNKFDCRLFISNFIEIALCCLLPQCEALCTCPLAYAESFHGGVSFSDIG